MADAKCTERGRNEDEREWLKVYGKMDQSALRELALEMIGEIVEAHNRYYSMVTAVRDRLRAVPENDQDYPAIAICEAYEDLASDISQENRLELLVDVLGSPNRCVATGGANG